MQTANHFLSKRNGVWYVWFRDESDNQRKVSTRCKLKRDAQKFRDEFIRGKLEKLARRKVVTLSKFKEEYKQFSANHHTVKSRKSAISALNVFQKAVGDKRLQDVTVRDAEAFIGQRMDCPATARKLYVTLAAAFQKAIMWGYLSENPLKMAPKPKLIQKEKPFLNFNDFSKLYVCIDNEDFKDLVTVAFVTGMRSAELRNLSFDAIDFRTGQLRVKNTATFTTKSKRERKVPLNPIAIDILQKRKMAYPDLPVFTWYDEKLRMRKEWSEPFVSKRFKKYVKLAQLDDKLNFHTLRHSFASNLVSTGRVSLYQVQKLLGHSNSSTTQQYSHLLEGSLTDAVMEVNFEAPVDSWCTVEDLPKGKVRITPCDRATKGAVNVSQLPQLYYCRMKNDNIVGFRAEFTD